MSDFHSLTKEQQAYLMQLARQNFPAKSLPQQRARSITPEEEEPDIYGNQEEQPYGEYLPDDDSEGGQLYCSDEEIEKDDANDQEIQVSSLETT